MKIDYSKDKLLTEFSHKTLEDRYLVGNEKSPQEAFARAAKAFADDEDHAQRLYDYASNLWFMFSTPVLSNGGTERGMPISCFLNYVEDSREGITDHYTENAYLSSFGGGIGGSWSAVRSQGTATSKGSESTGAIPFMKVVDAEMLAFSQGVTRRGSYAGYMHITHPEVEEFLDIRKPTGGDVNRKCTNLHHGVVINDKFMETIHRATHEENFDDSWELIDPHSQEVKKVVSARTLWVKLLQNRMETGEPYLMFEDAVNADLPDFQKRKGLYVNHSNLCSEITLATNEERTAVCCLSSVNLEYYDEWSKIPAFIPDLVRMLDNVLEYFIGHAPSQMEKAKYSAKKMKVKYYDLENKRVFITGGGSGIGASIVEHFCEQGSEVYFIDINVSESQKLIESIKNKKYSIPTFIECDLLNIKQLQKTIADIIDQKGPIDILINNAANDTRHKIDDVTEEYWNERINVNLRHYFFTVQSVKKSMIENKGGVIVNMGSASWMVGQGGMAAYTAAKSGVVGLTRSFARDLGEFNIRVNSVVPGWVLTQRQIDMWLNEESEKDLMKNQCLKEKLMPHELAQTVLFFSSEQSSGCTNQSYIVDKGWL